MRPSALVEMTIREAAAKAGGWYVPNGTVPEEHISDAAAAGTIQRKDRNRTLLLDCKYMLLYLHFYVELLRTRNNIKVKLN